MTSSTRQIANIIMDSLVIIFSSINIFISTPIFCFIIYHIIKTKKSPNRVALLLTANMYLALLFSSIIFLEQYIHVLPKHLYSSVSLSNGLSCSIRSYFLWTSIGTIYYSNSLQAVYRLCRIVFYFQRSLQSFQLYKILIIIQWIISFLVMIPALSIGDFIYLTDNYYCDIDYTNFRIMAMNGGLADIIPICTTIGCYMYTLRKMRKQNNNLIQKMTHIQRISARRDLIVLFRICVLLGLLLTVSIPPMIAILFNAFTGHLPWWFPQIQWVMFSFLTISVSIVLALISPHVKNLWKTNSIHHHHHQHTTGGLAIIRIN